jgi:hypothetical protein
VILMVLCDPDNDDDHEGMLVTVCQGPPVCQLVDDEAIQAMKQGCPWCKRIFIAPDGSEAVIEPGRA